MNVWLETWVLVGQCVEIASREWCVLEGRGELRCCGVWGCEKGVQWPVPGK